MIVEIYDFNVTAFGAHAALRLAKAVTRERSAAILQATACTALLFARNPMSYAHILLDQQTPIATLTLNRPDKRNALSADMMREITHALCAVGESDARGLILEANGPVFSAGHSFADMAGQDLDHLRALFDLCTTMMNTVQALPQPVIAKVHALATAAGCQLVATCDLALAADTAGFAIPGGKASLFCHTPLVAVARNIGRKRAMEMALTGDAIDAATAADWGLINRAVPAAQLDAATLDLIDRASRGCPVSKGMGKQGYYQHIDLPQPEAYVVSGERMAQGAARDIAQESFSAFLNKSKA